MAIRRHGKPYVHATWLAKLLGGQQCAWRVWFKARFQHDKYELNAGDLVQWNRDHGEMMRTRVRELQREGFSVQTEEQCKFKLDYPALVLGGKPDIVASKPGFTLIVDGKTGRQRESDLWQVLIYLRTYPQAKRIAGDIEGEVQYKRGDERITVTPSEWTDERLRQVTELMKTIASADEPPRVPSYHECSMCDIGPKDCPQRVREDAPAVAASGF